MFITIISIILGLFVVLIISFLLALRSLSELEVPKEVLERLKKGQPPPKFWGMIVFLKGRVLHYSSSSTVESGASLSASSDDVSSNNSVNSSERMEV